MTDPTGAAPPTAPAGFFQERMLRLAPAGVDDDVCVCVSWLPVAWSEQRWRRCLDLLARRHEPLRTRLAARDEAVVQVVDGDAGPALRWRTLADRSRPFVAAVEEAAELAASDSFDLLRGPLARVTVLDPAGTAQGQAAVWRFSHAIWDGFSTTVLERDLRRFDADDALPQQLPLSYSQLLARRRQEQLWSAPIAPRPPAAWSDQQAEVMTRTLVRAGTFRPGARAALTAAARAEGTTEPIACLAVAAGALSAALDRRRLTVALMDAARALPGSEQIIGCVVDVVLVPLTRPAELPFRARLRDVRDAVLDAYDERLPLEAALATAPASQRIGTAPVADLLYNFQPGSLAQPPAGLAGDELRVVAHVSSRYRVRARGAWHGAATAVTVAPAADAALGLWVARDLCTLDDAALARFVAATDQAVGALVA